VTAVRPRLLVTALAVALTAAAPSGCGGADDGGLEREPAVASAPGPQRPFVASVRADRAVVWAVGDGADGDDEGRLVARRIVAGRIDRLLYLGDVYDDGTAEEYAEHYAPVYGRFARITAPTPGNHEWDNRAEGYDAYWRRVTGRTPPRFYAFTVAGWTFLSLNSEDGTDEDAAQVAWLRRRLAGPGDCRVAFWHKPRYSAGKHGDDEEVAPLWNALRGRARVVINGHDHDMQRLRPRDGITAFVSGAGGKELYELDRDRADLAFGNDDAYGALRLDVRPGVIRHSFVTAEGRTLDAGTVRCSPP
jgi:hypothetical protein